MDKQLVQITDLVKDYAKIIDNLTAELEEYRSIAEKVGAAKAISEKEKWEACADRLIVYAKKIQSTMLVTSSTSAFYEAVCEDIREYNNLKKEFTDGDRNE